MISSAPADRAGVASAVVNASRQASGVLGVALLGSLVAGDGGADFAEGLKLAGVVCAAVLGAGAAVSIVYVRAPGGEKAPEEAEVTTAP